MRLDGPGLALAFALAVAYGLIVDPALFARIFRYRAALVVGSALVVLVATSAVFLPFIVIAPFAQYLAMRHGRRWPGWIAAWMALQLALLPAFFILGVTDRYYRHQEFVAGHAEGHQARAGEPGALLECAEQRMDESGAPDGPSVW